MKNIYLILLLISAFFLKSQTWCPPGATWHFDVDRVYPYVDGVATYTLEPDAVINGITTKKLTGTFKGIHQLASGGSMSVTTLYNFNNFYSYINNNVIYLYNPHFNVFDTVVNFNANIGDKWLRLNYSYANGYACNNFRKSVVVTDTGYVTINSINLRKIVTSYTAMYAYGTNTGTSVYTNTLVERVSNLADFMFPHYCEENNGISHTLGYGTFRCYEDSNFPLFKKEGVVYCEYNTTDVTKQDSNSSNVSIYPNPTNDNLTVKLNYNNLKRKNIRVYNLLGEKIISTVYSEELLINFTEFGEGIYFLHLYEDDQLVVSKKILKH